MKKSGLPIPKPAKSPAKGQPTFSPSSAPTPKHSVTSPNNKNNNSANVSGTHRGMVGIRYITEDLVRKVSGKTSWEQITSLNLTLAKEGKKIKFIENLERLRNLKILNLRSNVIEKIEKLDKLSRLQELNLSYNHIGKIEGLESLINLQVLNVTGNQIEHIPNWFTKKLKALQVLLIAANNIQSLQEFTKLRPLKDLTQLSVDGNPVSKLPHCRLFLAFHLRTLDIIDVDGITWEERSSAQDRFAQDEIEYLESLVQNKEQELYDMKQVHDKSMNELQARESSVKDKAQRLKEQQEMIKELQNELNTKNDLLKRKTSELTTACEKHYELEQELAFYKIDHKFEALGKIPSPESASAGEDGGLIGESPYIGRGRFKKKNKPHQLFKEQRAKVDEQLTPTSSQESFERQERIAKIQELDTELEQKKAAVDRAQEQLNDVQNELRLTEDQLIRAQKEKEELSEVKQSKSLTEDEKQAMRSRLTSRINKIHLLKTETQDIEGELAATEKIIQSMEKEIMQLRGQLRRTPSKDSLYSSINQEVADKEMQLKMSHQQYETLQNQLDDMLHTITKETEEIKKLDQQLREGHVAHNEELKQELEGIIDGLQTYLGDVKLKAEMQRDDYINLLGEREDLVERISSLENENERLSKQEDHLSLLQQQLGVLEDSLNAERVQNKSLQKQLNQSLSKVEEEQDLSLRLTEAEEVIVQLKEELAHIDRKTKHDTDLQEQKLEAERRHCKELEKRADNVNILEEELLTLKDHLAELQNANTSLHAELKAEKNSVDVKAGLIDRVELEGYLDDVLHSIQTGKILAPLENEELNQTLGHFRDQINQEIDANRQESEQALKAKEQAEVHASVLRANLDKLSRTQRMAERSIQDQIADDRNEMNKLKKEIQFLRNQLEKEREARDRPIPNHLLEPTARSSASTTSSTFPSSQWSERRHRMYNSMLPDEQLLFDELQDEINELRNLLGKGHKDAVEMASQAERKARKLEDMIEGRYRRQSGHSLQSQDMNTLSETQSEIHGRRKHHDRPVSRLPQLTQQFKDPRLREAAESLIHAEEEIESLHHQLQSKDQQLQAEINHADKSQGTIVAQNEEINNLHLVLEEQKNEINRLADVLNALQSQSRDQYASFDEDLHQLSQGTANLRSHLANQRPYIQNLAHSNPHSASALEDIPKRTGVDFVDNHPNSQTVMHHPSDRPGTLNQQPFTYPTVFQRSEDVPTGHQQPLMSSGGGQRSDGYMMTDPTIKQPLTRHKQGRPRPEIFPEQGPAVNLAASGQANSAPYVAHGTMQSGIYPYTGQANADAFNQVPSGHLTYQPASAHPGHAQVGLTPPGGAQPNYIMIPSQPTTPIAGSVMNAALLKTPNMEYSQPVMVSTPVSSPAKTSGPKKGILKKEGRLVDSGDELVCNVPEHHDLEDYIAKLQGKIKSLKNRLKEKREQSEEESRRVLFEDDVERKTIRRLKGELEIRRAELEALDLAVEQQRSGLELMKEKEFVLRAQRQAAKNELLELRKERTKKERRRAFLDGQHDYDVYDSDYEYDFNPRAKRIRRSDFIADEITCLEETLAKRRAELREADQLVEECEIDLMDARKEAKRMMEHFDKAKLSYTNTVQDAEEIELRTQEAGILLVKNQERLKLLEENVEEMSNLRANQEEMLKDIQKVISAKDAEFQELEAKLTHTRQILDQTEGQLEQTESARNQRLTQLTQGDQAMNGQQHNLEVLQSQIETCQLELEALDKDVGKGKAELEILTETIKKRSNQLDALDRDMEEEIEKRRKQIKELENKLESLLKQKRLAESDIKEGSLRLKQIQDETDREEAILQNLAETTNEQRSILHKLESQLLSKQSELEHLLELKDLRESELTQTDSRYSEDEKKLKRLNSEIKSQSLDLAQLKQNSEEVENQLEKLKGEHNLLEPKVKSLRTERVALEDAQRHLEKSITQLKKSHAHVEESVQSSQQRLSKLKQERREMESDLSKGQRESLSLQNEIAELKGEVQGNKHELEMLQAELESAQGQYETMQQREAETKRNNQMKIDSLESKISELGVEIEERDKEKEQLAQALNCSHAEVESLRTQIDQERDSLMKKLEESKSGANAASQELERRVQEFVEFRSKAAQQMSDLESIAQSHYNRANRLNDELNYLRADYLEAKQQLQSQKEMEIREKKLEDALKDLKADIKQEVTGTLVSLEHSRLHGSSNELSALHQERSTLEHRLQDLKHNLNVIRAGSSDKKYTVADQFEEQQNYLKRQLMMKMDQHAELMQTQRQVSTDNIRHLEDKLVSLETLLSVKPNKTTDIYSLVEQKKDSPLTTADLIAPSSEASYKSHLKHAYSPNRYSQKRARGSPSPDNLIPVRDLSEQ